VFLTAYVLVIMVFSSNGTAITTLPGFSRAAACETAKIEVEKLYSGVRATCISNTGE
jgi:hypothetical protein